MIPEFDHYLAAANLVAAHNNNATDAILLDLYRRYFDAMDPADRPGVLIATDARLIRAATADALPTINPETISPADIPARLAALT